MKKLVYQNNVFSNTGFTLIELLIATVITSIVVTFTGFGVVTLLRANQKAEADTSQRSELNRALDFIADEIRESTIVRATSSYTEGSDTTVKTTDSYEVTTNIGTGALHLTIPEQAEKHKVYYIRPSTESWRNPQTVNRASGTFNSGTTNVSGTALVDAVSDTTPSSLSCPSDARYMTPPKGSVTGFYACLDSITNARIVELHLIGKAVNGAVYEVKTRVFPRVTRLPLTSPVLSASIPDTTQGFNQTVNLSWTAVSGATDYRVYMCGPAASSCTPSSTTAIFSGSGTSYTVPSTAFLAQGSNIVSCFGVIATNNDGSTSLLSALKCINKVVSGPNFTTSTATGSAPKNVALIWNSIPGTSTYTIHRCGPVDSTGCTPTTSDFQFYNGALLTASGTLSGTAPTYTSCFAAIASKTSSSETSTMGNQVCLDNGLATPTLTATTSGTGNSKVGNLTWATVAGATTYTVYKCGPGNSACTPGTTQLYSGSNTSVNNISLGNNNDYTCFSIKASSSVTSEESSVSSPICLQK